MNYTNTRNHFYTLVLGLILVLTAALVAHDAYRAIWEALQLASGALSEPAQVDGILTFIFP